MNKLYLWLQKEDNGKRVSEYYWKEQFHKNKLDITEEKYSRWMNAMLSDCAWIENAKKEVAIILKNTASLSPLHAQYNPNIKQIKIFQNWVTAYSDFMSEDLARKVHVYHELYHVFEEQHPVWYANYKYKKRCFLSEYFALELARKFCGLDWSCAMYDLCICVKDEKKTKLVWERRLNDETFD